VHLIEWAGARHVMTLKRQAIAFSGGVDTRWVVGCILGGESTHGGGCILGGELHPAASADADGGCWRGRQPAPYSLPVRWWSVTTTRLTVLSALTCAGACSGEASAVERHGAEAKGQRGASSGQTLSMRCMLDRQGDLQAPRAGQGRCGMPPSRRAWRGPQRRGRMAPPQGSCELGGLRRQASADRCESLPSRNRRCPHRQHCGGVSM